MTSAAMDMATFISDYSNGADTIVYAVSYGTAASGSTSGLLTSKSSSKYKSVFIVFLVLFVVALGIAGFFWYRWHKTKTQKTDKATDDEHVEISTPMAVEDSQLSTSFTVQRE
ncbi:hypothetical protein GQ600_16239 [Phytophthora cactorum]|nr:hypothetical protein GQ600_16239 [Phytophthora cactorum]